MVMDPRLADRRKEVAEDRARKNVKRLLRLIIVLGSVGALVWLFLSPALSVQDLEVSGVHSSRASEILTEENVVPGTPLILIRGGTVEQRLLADPWVKTAVLDRQWPDRVVVTIEERSPVAWVQTGEGWARRAVDAVALPGAETPDDTMAHIELPDVADTEVYESFEVIGALEFVDELGATLSSATVVEERAGELWALVSGFEVRLGRPTEMVEKARSLMALLETNLAPGSVINLIAPTNPAVVPGAATP